MHRITQKDIAVVFARFARACGKTVGTEAGCWGLDCAPCYGGWTVTEYLHGGGETRPLGDRRMSGSEIYHAMHFAMRAMEVR